MGKTYDVKIGKTTYKIKMPSMWKPGKISKTSSAPPSRSPVVDAHNQIKSHNNEIDRVAAEIEGAGKNPAVEAIFED